MPIKSFPKEIDGVNYEVTQFPADEAIVIMTKLLEIFGTSVGNIVEGSVPKKNQSSTSIWIFPLLVELFHRLSCD